METLNTSRYALFLFVAFMTVSCGKDDDNPPPQPTVEELLTATGKWYMESITNEALTHCDRTSYWEFSGGNLKEQWLSTGTDGYCTTGYLEQFKYDLVNDTQLNLSSTKDGGTTEVTIVSISETRLTVRYPNDDVIIFDKNPGNE